MITVPKPATSACTNKPEDGGWEADGAWCETALDALQQTFGFCGCGDPDGNVHWILAGLRLITENGPETTAPYFMREPDSPYNLWWKDHEKQCLAYFGSEQGDMFFRYWADKEGLTEHGTGLHGAWLSDLGKQLLAFYAAEVEGKK